LHESMAQSERRYAKPTQSWSLLVGTFLGYETFLFENEGRERTQDTPD